MAAFHTRIADPAIGGTYMTLLVTSANLGGTWPRWFVLRGVDAFTRATCALPGVGPGVLGNAAECASAVGRAACAAVQGACVVERDGYFVVQAVCGVLGLVTILGYVIPQARKLQGECLRGCGCRATAETEGRSATGEMEAPEGDVTGSGSAGRVVQAERNKDIFKWNKNEGGQRECASPCGRDETSRHGGGPACGRGSGRRRGCGGGRPRASW
jgi:hypothetical protein